jgi:hypothetical protein
MAMRLETSNIGSERPKRAGIPPPKRHWKGSPITNDSEEARCDYPADVASDESLKLSRATKML